MMSYGHYDMYKEYMHRPFTWSEQLAISNSEMLLIKVLLECVREQLKVTDDPQRVIHELYHVMIR